MNGVTIAINTNGVTIAIALLGVTLALGIASLTLALWAIARELRALREDQGEHEEDRV
jgi:hypothetical protein